MNNKVAIVIAAAAAVVAVVCLVLVLNYKSTESAVTRQLQQVEQAQQRAQVAAARTAQQADDARLGICWSSTEDSSTFDLQSLEVESPILSGGVYQCPTGTNFVSVVPVSGGG